MDGEVQLVGGYNVKEGKVQVCYLGEWHSVCSDTWSETGFEADIVCSTLGYSPALGQTLLALLVCYQFCMCIHSVSVKTTFSRERNPILPKDIQCNGDEVTLNMCNVTEFDPAECKQIVGVICEGLFIDVNI